MPGFLVLALTLATTASTAPDSTLTRQLDQYLEARERLGQFSGSVIVASHGRVLLRKGYGFADLEHRARNTATTSYEIASLTKAFTAYAVLLLADDGKLRLDHSITEYLPGAPAAWKDVTVDQVIHHTSGIWDYESALDLGSPAFTERMKQPGTGRSLVEDAKSKPLDFPPGSKFHYSNTGYLILGAIIEHVSGMSYEAFLRSRVFGPLGLSHTRHIARDKPVAGAAKGYTHSAPLDSSVLGFPLTSHWLQPTPVARLDAPHADGGLRSTVDDLFRWTRALDDSGPIPAERRARLAGSEEGYAYGWIRGTRFDRLRLFHTGVLPGFVSEIDRYPESGTTIIVLSNLERSRTSAIARDLSSIVFELPYDVPRAHRVGRIDSLAAKPFLGKYALDDGRQLILRHDPAGMLEAESPGQFIAGLLPETHEVFYAPMWEGTVSFAGDSAGARTRVVVRQQGKDIAGRRVDAGP
jgi:CubicO group peptidase (beta-lactamase class C family)